MSKKKTTYRSRGTDTPEAPIGVIDIDSKVAAATVDEAEQVAIFRIDGKTYSMPKAERADVALAYLNMVQTEGEDAASRYLIVETLGEEALEALAGVKGLSAKQWNGVMKSVRRIALPKDRGRRGDV